MTLFASLSVGASAVNANQLALRVVGNNIANANSEGYVREEIRVGSLPSVRFGNISLGTGASAVAVQQQIDRYLRERSREAGSDFEAASAQSTLYRRLEGVFGELTDEDLSTAMGDFFRSLQDVANKPDDLSRRQLVVSQADTLTMHIRSLREKMGGMVEDINSEIETSVNQINASLDAVRQLNVRIIEAESGSSSDAGALRSQRDVELDKLSKLIPIQVHEQPNSSVNILTDGDYLLFNGSIQEVGFITTYENDLKIEKLAFVESERELPTTGGRLGGIQEFRDNDLREAIDRLDNLARNLIDVFNDVHSSGQGLDGFTSLEGTYRAIDPTAAMNTSAAGLIFSPQNGSFQIKATNVTTKQTQTFDIDVDLDGIGTDDSLNDVVSRINTVAFGGATVFQVNAQGRVQFTAPTDQKISFANDNSGFLSSFGLNTFFDGQNSRDIRLNANVALNPALLAASSNGTPGDNSNALNLTQLESRSLNQLDGQSMEDYLTDLVGALGSGSEKATMQASILESSKVALESENLAITGVSLDEEAVKLITYQRAFQASARYISTINDLLDELINLGR